MKIKPRFYARYLCIPIITWVGAALVLYWGWINCSGSDGTPFTRAGAVISVMAVIVGLWRYQEGLNATVALTTATADRRLARMNVRAAIRDHTTSDLDSKARAKFEPLERTIAIVFALQLLLGTAVWGFGDLIYSCRHDGAAMARSLIHLGGKTSSRDCSEPSKRSTLPRCDR